MCSKICFTIFLALILGIFTSLSFAEDSENSCGGDNALLSIVNRPSAADSACVVPDKSFIFEGGYQYLTLDPYGYGQNGPQASTRFGLPFKTEFVALLPNYYHDSVYPYSGFGSTLMGLKHEFFANSKWIFTLENLIIPSSGSKFFGNQGFGDIFNGILSYNFTDDWSLTAMLGFNTQTLPIAYGGGRFNSVYSDFLLQWSKDRLAFYGELYSQTKPSPYQGLGINFDGGILYLIRKNISVDIEIGRRVYGDLGGFNLYFGTGLAIWL